MPLPSHCQEHGESGTKTCKWFSPTVQPHRPGKAPADIVHLRDTRVAVPHSHACSCAGCPLLKHEPSEYATREPPSTSNLMLMRHLGPSHRHGAFLREEWMRMSWETLGM